MDDRRDRRPDPAHDDADRPTDDEAGPGSDPGIGYEWAIEEGVASAEDEETDPPGPGAGDVFRSGS